MIDSKQYEVCFKTQQNFVNFVKICTDDLPPKDVAHIEWLVQRIASNMYYHPNNIERAKSDYIFLVAMLIEKGFVFKEFQDLIPSSKYPD